jgi:hypothetical protein
MNPQRLVPQGEPTRFRDGFAAGFVLPTTVTLTGIPADAPVAVFQVRAWANTPAEYGLRLSGASQTFLVENIGGTFNPAPTLDGFRSFNLVQTFEPDWLPEPSSITLSALAAAVLLIFRRR